MKKYVLISLIFLFAIFLSGCSNKSYTDDDIKCSEYAKKVFDSYKSSEAQYWYSNHYNRKLGKCLLLTNRVYSNPEFGQYWDKRLISVYENKDIGAFNTGKDVECDKYNCFLGDKILKADDDFDKLVEEYMNN